MDCIYCGKPAGWFRRLHAECRARHEVGRQQLSKLFQGCLRASTPADQLARDARAIADAHFLAAEECHSLAVAGFQGAVEEALDDRLLSKEEEGKLDALMSAFALSKVDIGACAKRFNEQRFPYLVATPSTSPLALWRTRGEK